MSSLPTTKQEWLNVSWRNKLALTRSGLQKANRRGLDELIIQLVVLSIKDGKGLSPVRNLILFMVEDMATSPHLFAYVVPKVKDLLQRAPKASELEHNLSICKEIFALVRLVGLPRWSRQRFVAMLANRSLAVLEREEKVDPTSLLGQASELDRLWVKDEKQWKKAVLDRLTHSTHPIRSIFVQAFRLLSNRLVPLMYLCIEHKTLPVPSCQDIAELHDGLLQWDPTEALNQMTIPDWPDFVLDKHTSHGRDKGLQHFFDEGAKVVNEASVPLILKQWVQEGYDIYFQMEEEHGTKGARSSAVKKRLLQKWNKKRPVHSEKLSTFSEMFVTNTEKGKKQETSPQKKKQKKNDGDNQTDFQDVMRQRWEPYMPPELRGKIWLQKVTSESKRMTMAHEGQVWKGPFPLDYKAKQLVQTRYEAVRKSGAFTPEASWVVKEAGGRPWLWWVSNLISDIENPFESSRPLNAILDDANFIKQVVKSGVVKLSLEMGDLCTRNMPWSSSLSQFVILDFEDANNNLPDLDTCDLFELCFSPVRRARQEKRARLEQLMVKHKEVIIQGLREIQVNGSMKVSVVQKAMNRMKQ